MSATDSALRQVNHDLSLDRGRELLDIPVDQERHARLLKRREELEAERDIERQRSAAVLAGFEQRTTPKPRPPAAVEPSGMDESVSEAEHRVTFGKSPRAIPSWM